MMVKRNGYFMKERIGENMTEMINIDGKWEIQISGYNGIVNIFRNGKCFRAQVEYPNLFLAIAEELKKIREENNKLKSEK